MALDVALVKISGSARVECGINLIIFGHTDVILFIENSHEQVSNIFSYSVEQVIAVHGAVAAVVCAADMFVLACLVSGRNTDNLAYLIFQKDRVRRSRGLLLEIAKSEKERRL